MKAFSWVLINSLIWPFFLSSISWISVFLLRSSSSLNALIFFSYLASISLDCRSKSALSCVICSSWVCNTIFATFCNRARTKRMWLSNTYITYTQTHYLLNRHLGEDLAQVLCKFMTWQSCVTLIVCGKLVCSYLDIITEDIVPKNVNVYQLSMMYCIPHFYLNYA